MFNAKSYAASKRKGYRSGLEVEVQKQLTEAKLDVGYETIKIEWEDLAYRKYTPDFVLPNGVRPSNSPLIPNTAVAFTSM